MGNVERAVFNHIITHAPITALVADVFHEVAPQGQGTPFILINLISNEFLEEGITFTASAAVASVQLDIYASSSGKRFAIAEQLESRFRRFRGDMGDVPLNVGDVLLSGPDNSYAQPRDGDDVGRFRARFEASVFYTV